MTVRIAVLGSGFVSEFYLLGLRDVPDHQVVVNYSQTAERAAAFAQRWDIPNHTTTMAAAVDRPDVDLVLIGLPNDVHLTATRLVTRAKKHVVCTKPLARTGQEAAEMLHLVEAAGVLHGYAETEVFSPAVVRVRQMIEAGAIDIAEDATTPMDRSLILDSVR